MKKFVLLLAVVLSCIGLSAQCVDNLVELGLSVKWSSVNLGADSPESIGNYYQAGVPTIPSDYSNWPYEAMILPDFEGTDKDAATVNLGKGWSTPSVDQWYELIKFCNFEAVEINGVAGVKVTSKITGNHIFLPAAGYMNGRKIDSATDTYYLTTRKDSYTSMRVFSYVDGKESINRTLYGGYGLPVRPVYLAPDPAEIDLTMKKSSNMSVAIGQTGGNFDFTGFKLTFDIPTGFSVESAMVAPGRCGTATPDVKISENAEGNTVVTVTNPNNVVFIRHDTDGGEVDSLLTVTFNCVDGTPNGDFMVTLLSASILTMVNPRLLLLPRVICLFR